MRLCYFGIGVASALATCMMAVSPLHADKPKVKLVVQVTVDMLRGDMPSRFADRFEPNGFRYLMERGVWYTDAHFMHATTYTAVGHATLFTGGNPPEHGLVGNDWLDLTTGRQVYCVEDDRHHVIDQPPRDHEGVSPRNLIGSTTGDELYLATAGRSRIYSVSIKDRGAILPGGHLGKAFWYDRRTGHFVTSTYYYDENPQWVTDFNDAGHADAYMGQKWELLRDRDTYIYRDQDDRPSERPHGNMGRTFPMPLGDADDREAYYSALRFAPHGDELTLKFAKTLMAERQLGQREATDLLAISFSATDYIGHAHGPNSLQYEDNMLRMDRTLAQLFRYIDDTVGLEHTLVVLSSDHGTDSIPEFRAELTQRPPGRRISLEALEHAHRSNSMCCGRHDPSETIAQLNKALRDIFKVNANLVQAFWNPSLYLDEAAIAHLDLPLEAVESAVAELIVQLPGYALALTRTQLVTNQVPDLSVPQAMLRAFHPRRSGHVMVVQQPFWYLHYQPQAFAAMHGSPYSYDTFVPIMFAGPGIAPKHVARRVAPRDVAPTIAAYLGIQPPSGSVGNVLKEVVQQP